MPFLKTLHVLPLNRLRLIRSILICMGVIWFALTMSQNVRADNSPTEPTAAQPHHKPDVKAWKTSREQGQKAFEQKHYAEAETFFKGALEQAVNFGPKDVRLAESLFDLAVVYFDTGQYAAGEPLCRKAAEIRHGGPSPALEVECLNLFAMTSVRLAHYDEAIKAYERAEMLVSRLAGRDNPGAVRFRYERGLIFYVQGDYAQAEPLLKSSAALFEHPASRIKFQTIDPAVNTYQVWRITFRPDSDYAFDALSRLTVIYSAQNRLSEAE